MSGCSNKTDEIAITENSVKERSSQSESSQQNDDQTKSESLDDIKTNSNKEEEPQSNKTNSNIENKIDASSSDSTKTKDSNKSAKESVTENSQAKIVDQSNQTTESEDKNSNSVITISSPENVQNKPTHTHEWKPIYSTIHHEEIGHYADVLVEDAWTEIVPNYGLDERMICNGCGTDMTDWSNEAMKQHTFNGVATGNLRCGAWHSEFVSIPIDPIIVDHPAKYESRYIIDQPAWDEQIISGYICNCGSSK